MRPGLVVVIEAPKLARRIYLVADPETALMVSARGVPRSEVWTVEDVRELLRKGVTREDAVKIANMRTLFDGVIPDGAQTTLFDPPKPKKPRERA